MIETEKIRKAVINMFKVNMGVKPGEKILVLTDTPRQSEWMSYNTEKLTEMVRRSLLAKAVSDIATEAFTGNTVHFFAYLSAERHGKEPGREVEEEMKKSDVVAAITTYSLTHTDARQNACEAGARVASMPMFLQEMFYTGGAMSSDYEKIADETTRISKRLTNTDHVQIRSREGTNLTFSLKGRTIMADTGIFKEKGVFGNLPSGEAYVPPVQGTGEGKLVVEAGWHPNLQENMTIQFEEGKVVNVLGGGKVGDEFRRLLDFAKDEEPYISRRNLAELGVGTNPNAKRPDNVLEAEKIRGTVHVAIGDNSHMGGEVTADLHQDFVIPEPDLVLDGTALISKGKTRPLAQQIER